MVRATFDGCFKFNFIAEVRQEGGSLFLIGDNPLTHISSTLLDERHTIHSSNTTHVTQKVDVAFFETF